MFKARHKDEFQTLRVLHPKFVKEGNYSAALLCLDRVFASTLPATQGALTADPGPDLSLHLTYFELLDRLRREDCLDTKSICRKVFAFQPRQDDRFFIPTNSFLHTVFLSKPDTVREDGGFVVAHEELRRTLDHEIPVFIHDRAKEQHSAYRRRLGAAPCLTYMTRGECRTQDRKQDRKQDLRRDRKQDQKKDCQFQHLRSDEMTVEWFNTCVQSVMMEMRILNLAGFCPKGVILYVPPLVVTTPDSDPVHIDTGFVSSTLSCTPRIQNLGLSQCLTLGTHLNRRRGSGFCGNGSGRRVTGSCSAHRPGWSTSKPSSPSLWPLAPWHTTSTLSEPKYMSLERGCADMGTRSGRRASLGQGFG